MIAVPESPWLEDPFELKCDGLFSDEEQCFLGRHPFQLRNRPPLYLSEFQMMLRDIDRLRGQIQDKKDNLASFTLSALKNYIHILRLTDDQNTKYRIFSLWYSHKDDPDISKILQKTMNELTSDSGTLPVHGFTDMFYQLAACMGECHNSVQFHL